MEQNRKSINAIPDQHSWVISARLNYFLKLAGIAILYFGAAELGLSLAYFHGNVSPVWPPAGVAIAAVLLFGLRVWPAIVVGAFFANLFTEVPILTVAGITIGNTLEALSAGYLLRRLDFHNSLDRAVDVFKFVVAVLFCTMLSATIGNLSLCLGGAAKWDDFSALWLTWWLGDMMGALVVAPLLLTWGSTSRWRLQRMRIFEGAVLLVLLSLASVATFFGSSTIPLRYYPVARLIVPFFLWAAFRLGQRGVTVATVTISLFAIWGTVNGLGLFAGRTPNDALLALQVFLGSNVAMFLFLAASLEERRNSEETLRESERRIAANLAVTKILVESPALRDATTRIIRTIGKMLDWKVGAMWTPDPEGKELRCLNFWNDPTVTVETFKSVTLTTTFSNGVGLPGRVWTSLEPAWIPDVRHDDNFPRAPSAVAESLHSAFAFPIMFGGEFLGVMEFFSDEIREPDDTLLAMFGSIGNQIGQFIERKKAEDEREYLLVREHAARSEAELANRAKDEFLAIVSHELRTPLNAIVGWATMLRSGALDESNARRAIEVIDRNARAQAQLIEDLLDVSRVVSGNLRIDPRPVQLQQVIEAAIDSIRPAADAKNIDLQLTLDPNVGPVSGDPDRLQQVVWNLLSNAVKFTPSEGEVAVRVESSDSQIEIIVSDTGEGIAPEFLPRVFDRFRQADSSTTRRHGGLGLGLAIVRNLVELHGGRVKVQSDGVGKGTTFSISLPPLGDAQNEPLRQGQLGASLAAQFRRRELVGLRILSVDDDPDTREMIDIVLRSQGADVVSVGSAKEAIQIVIEGRWKPEVLLSDLGMPDEDGYDLIRKVRLRRRDEGGEMPAIAITGYAGSQEEERALKAGFQAHLTKPIDWNHLVKVIKSYAENKAPGKSNGEG